MITTTIFPGRYVQGAQALSLLNEECARLGKGPLIIIDDYVRHHYEDKIAEGLNEKNLMLEHFNGECSREEINRLVMVGKTADADVIIGVGGGKAMDTAKAVAHVLSVHVIIVPTIASTDAPCSALSVLYHPDGTFAEYMILPKNPDVVLVDTELIAEAPVRFLVAGMGDALATWFEAESCRIRRAANMTGRPGSMTAYSLARLCHDTLMEYGRMAETACQESIVTPALERIVEANTLLSGLGFESGGLAACHAIHNGLTVLKQTHEFWHGEKVAIGVLASLVLTDQPAALVDEIYEFCLDIGLPVCLEDIGLVKVSDQDLMKVATAACAPGETIHHEPHEVRPETVFSAIKAADAEGRRRKEERRND
jgi:glycerol dehydrogenase